MLEFIAILPETFLVLTVIAIILSEITYHGEPRRLVVPIASLGLVMALVQTVLTLQQVPTQVFNRALSIDGVSLVFKILFILLGIITLAASTRSREIADDRRAEFSALVVAATLAMCLLASAADLMLAYVSLMLLNILAYFLAGYAKRTIVSTEAAVKYLTFSTVGGGFLLYGFAILFGATHSLNMHEIHNALLANPFPALKLLVVFFLIFLALCFQAAAFPMHLWAPDVIEGAPTPVSAFLSFGTRAAAFALGLRLLIVVFAQPTLEAGQWQVLSVLGTSAFDWTDVVELVSGFTMIVGSLLAFRQTGAKRLVGYLGVAESGFLLMGILVLNEVGVAALLYNLIIQLFALTGTYFILSFFHDVLSSDRLEDLNGMLKRAVPDCICLLIFLTCLVGLPPTPGFVGKFTLIGVAVRHHRPILAATAIVSMVLSTMAIARLGYHLVGDYRKPQAAAIEPSTWRKVFLAALTVPMFLTGIFAEALLAVAGRTLGLILW